MDHHEDNDADAWAYRADAEYTFDNSDWLDKIRFGVRYEDYNSTTRETGYRWGSISQNWAGGPAVFSEQDVPFVQQDYSNWFHGGTAPSGFLFPDTSFFRNYQAWSNQVIAVSTAPGVTNGCCAWVPFEWRLLHEDSRRTTGWASIRKIRRRPRGMRSCPSSTTNGTAMWAFDSSRPRPRDRASWSSAAATSDRGAGR